jgi:hypothetical protein
MAGDEHGEHCAGKKFAVFDPNLHTELVTGFANSWIDVARRIETHWKDHPLYNEVRQERASRGSYGTAHVLTDFVDRLIAERKIIDKFIEDMRQER